MMVISISELAEYAYEDLDLKIEAVTAQPDYAFHVVLSLDDWVVDNTRRRFELIIRDVVQCSLAPGNSAEILWTRGHPLLSEMQDTNCSLYFLEKSEKANEILGILWNEHRKVLGEWFDFSESINLYKDSFPKLLENNQGLLAHGPKRLIDNYENALIGLIKTKRISSTFKRTGRFSNPKCLVFDCGYLIGNSVDVEEIGSTPNNYGLT